MIDLKKYKGLIFDMDGTIVDSMPGHVEAWRQTAIHYNFPFDAQAIYDMGGMPSEKIVEVFNQTYHLYLEPIETAAMKRAIFETTRDNVTIISHTVNIIKQHKDEKKIAVGTGSIRNNTDYILKRLNLSQYMDAIVTADDVENHKPAPDTFLYAAKQLQLTPDECIVFEDTQMGIQAAHQAGMNAIFVTKNTLTFMPVLQD